MPLRSSDSASKTTITAAIVRACSSSQIRTEPSTCVAQSRATSRSTSAIASGSSDTSEKNTHCTMYFGGARVGLRDVLERDRDECARIRERSAGADDRDHGRVGHLADLRRSCFGRLRDRWPPHHTRDQTRRNTAATMSTIATQVFGLDGSEDAATSPSTKAATTPIPSVPSARRGRTRRRFARAGRRGRARGRRTQRRRRQHRGQRSQRELGVDPSHVVSSGRPRPSVTHARAGPSRRASLPSSPREPPFAPRLCPWRRRTTTTRAAVRRSNRTPRQPARSQG